MKHNGKRPSLTVSMLCRIGAGSNASLAIQGGSPEAGEVPAPKAAAPEQDDAGKGGHGQLAYTWSIPAVPPSLQVANFTFMRKHTHFSEMAACSAMAMAIAAIATTPGIHH